MSRATSGTRFRTGKWLSKSGFAPHVYMFRNLERGQVVYTQVGKINQGQVNQQFARPNWENRKPSLRKDLWKCMCVVNTNDYDNSIKLYQNLTRLRHLRDVLYKSEAEKYRMKNEFGQTWYSGQYRPNYTQEAVADLRESLLNLSSEKSELDFKGITVYWEDPWRMGDREKYWSGPLTDLKHEIIARDCNVTRDESIVLKELNDKTLKGLAL